MTGPCLCGDPYCPSCGDPAAAALEEKIEQIMEQASELIQHPGEADVFFAAGKAAVEAARQYADEAVREQAHNDSLYIGYLREKLDQAKPANNPQDYTLVDQLVDQTRSNEP